MKIFSCNCVSSRTSERTVLRLKALVVGHLRSPCRPLFNLETSSICVRSRQMVGGGEGQTEEPGVASEERELEVVNAERRRAALQKYVALRDQFFPQVPEISGEELLQLVDGGAIGDQSTILVDCRSDAERKVSIYKGALSQAEFEANVDKYKNKEIIVYCAIGRRSGLFAKDLMVKYPGIKVRNHSGSVVDWTHVGGPFVDESTGTTTLHVHPNTTWIPYLPLGKGLQVFGV